MSVVYVHIPYRRAPNNYSEEFYVVTETPDTSFIAALLTEIDWYASRYADCEPVESLYIGGGEPSMLRPRQIDRICTRLRSVFDVQENAETTLEVNPADISRAYLEEVRTAGVNRLCLCAESFFDDDLSRLDCRHSAGQSREGFETCLDTNFASFNVDLRFGVPDQPFEYWAANLERCVEAEIPHLSTYRADLGARSTDSQHCSGSSTDTANDHYSFALDYLRQEEYTAYELSHFARPGHASCQLQRYWDHSNYLGFGPSAHSFWWSRGKEKARRWNNVANIARYRDLLAQVELPLKTRESLEPATLANEHILLRLQTAEGLDVPGLKNTYDVDLLTVKCEQLNELMKNDWIELIDNRYLRLTTRGRFRYETIASRLLISNDHVITS